MFLSLTNEMEHARELLANLSKAVYDRFHGNPLIVTTKSDGTEVTDLDWWVSKQIVDAYATRGIKVISEEGGTASPSARHVMVVDPIDGTSDLIAGQKRSPRVSLAMLSLGWLRKNSLDMGVACAPLLGGKPVMYLAAKDIGAHRSIQGRRVKLTVDAGPTKGIVLVSTKQTPEVLQQIELLKAVGLTPLALHGAVFKGCAFVDRKLLDSYKPRGLVVPEGPIVGFITDGWLHDRAAIEVIAREAGAIVTSHTGGETDLDGGRGCVMANNSVVHRLLLEIVQDAKQAHK